MEGKPCTSFVFGEKRRPRCPAGKALLVWVTLRTQHRTLAVVGARHITTDMHASRITEACAQGKAFGNAAAKAAQAAASRPG